MRLSARNRIHELVRILGIRFLYERVIKPRSSEDDVRRRELILNIILFGTISVLSVLGICIIISMIQFGSAYRGISGLIFFPVLASFIGLLTLSRKGYVLTSSWILVSLYFTLTLYSVFQWSFILPMIILGAFLTIVISGVLLSTQASIAVAGLLAAGISIITRLQIAGVVPWDLSWQQRVIRTQDVVEICTVLFLISLISWLSNRETERSLVRARNSEAALLKERDLLEVTVEERTRELKELQLHQVGQLAQLAEVGKTASGIFHDLMNPLNNVVLSIEELSRTHDDIGDAQDQVAKAVAASRKMGGFIGTIRKQIRPSNEILSFSPSREASDAIDILAYKARLSNVTCSLNGDADCKISGNPILYHQVALNLISNVIDSYAEISNSRERFVRISIELQADCCVLRVADSGCGIQEKNEGKIFEPFFTTKASQGLGIGLSHIKKIIEVDFGGTISFSSTPNEGTVFSVTTPLS